MKVSSRLLKDQSFSAHLPWMPSQHNILQITMSFCNYNTVYWKVNTPFCISSNLHYTLNHPRIAFKGGKGGNEFGSLHVEGIIPYFFVIKLQGKCTENSSLSFILLSLHLCVVNKKKIGRIFFYLFLKQQGGTNASSFQWWKKYSKTCS